MSTKVSVHLHVLGCVLVDVQLHLHPKKLLTHSITIAIKNFEINNYMYTVLKHVTGQVWLPLFQTFFQSYLYVVMHHILSDALFLVKLSEFAWSYDPEYKVENISIIV